MTDKLIMERRQALAGLLFAPAIIRTPGLLMAVRPPRPDTTPRALRWTIYLDEVSPGNWKVVIDTGQERCILSVENCDHLNEINNILSS